MTQSDLLCAKPKRKKGWPKGKSRGARSESDRLAISAGLKQRWQDSQWRSQRVRVCVQSWSTGSRAKDRVLWTEEMDARLRELHRTLDFSVLRTLGAQKIGVGEHTLRTRLKELGLSKRRQPVDWAALAGNLRCLVLVSPPLSWREIGERLGVSADQARLHARATGVAKIPIQPRWQYTRRNRINQA